VSLRVSTVALLDQRISALKAEVSRLQQELSRRQKELYVLQGAIRRLSEKTTSNLQADPPAANIPSIAAPTVVRKNITMGIAATRILRDCGKPMRVRDILAALHERGWPYIQFRSLNSVLQRYAWAGKLAHLERGFYASKDDVTPRQRELTDAIRLS